MAKDRNAAASGIATLLTKLNDPDPDIRYMQLSDLVSILNAPASDYIKTDSHTAARIIEGLLKALSDQHGEVQNQALKCVGPLAMRTPGEIVAPLIDKITDLTKSDIDLSIPNAALRTLIASLPQPQTAGITAVEVKDAYSAVSKVLIPRLIGHAVANTGKANSSLSPGLLENQKDKGYSSDAVDVMIEIVKCYGPLLQESELVALAKSVMKIIESPHAGGVVKKRALAGIGALLVHFNEAQLDSFVQALAETFRHPQLSIEQRRFLIATIGTLARSTPTKFGSHLKLMTPFVLGTLSQEELAGNADASDEDMYSDQETEELRETALVALDAMIGSCPTEMQVHSSEAVDAALRYLKYDPNVAEVGVTDDEDMGAPHDGGSDDGVTDEAFDEDDEYAELDDEDAFSDVDDLSWKVRRCAAKTLYTIIAGSTIADREMLFGKIAPILMSRLYNEREDTVRLEVISATNALIRKIGPGAVSQPMNHANGISSATPILISRKRRRQDSEVSLEDFDLKGLIQSRSSPPIIPGSPPSGGQADLADIIPNIIQALTKLWKKGSISLKQSSIMMLKSLALTRNGALAGYLQQLEDPIADALKPSTAAGSSTAASGSSATVASLQIETLALISVITETNATTILIPFVIALIPSVTSVALDRNYKVSSETLATMEQFVKALTPPRLPTANQDYAIHIEKLYEVIVDRVTDNNADLEVRHRAIQVFGVLISRTSSTHLLEASARTKALGILSDRLKNETTRLASARAVGLIGESASSKDSVGSAWTQEVSLEMANQLRKSDRALRGSCLEALQYLALNPVTASQYETHTILQMQSLLLPLIGVTDLHLLIPALVILAKIIPTNPEALVNSELVNSLCLIAQTRLEGPPLKAYLLTVKVIGEQGVGAALMKGLLTVGTSGETLVLGRAIGTLLVFGGSDLGVTVPDFLKELETSQDVRATCLALTVLGEVGFRMGSASPLGMDVFTKCLSADSEKVRLAAAVALGSASSSNITQFLPIILDNLSKTPGQDYLYLHALKEILQHTDVTTGTITPHTSELWRKLFAVSDTEDNHAVGAECIGRLAMIEPSIYVPELSKSLQNSTASIRGLVISAFRFTLADSTASYNVLLAKMIIPILKAMLSDSDINNRRLAVTTLNAAIHNKPEFVVSDINELLPPILEDSKIKPELIKVITIGPFKHNEDSGLDLRKAAYATIYALLDCAAAVPQLPIPRLFDRILDGVPDDHDIRTLCNLMLGRLTNINPDETRRRLSPLAEKFKIVLGQKIKENAVKQEIEKVNEANAAVIRITLELDKNFPTAATDGSGEMVVWKGYLEYVKKDFASIIRGIQSEF